MRPERGSGEIHALRARPKARDRVVLLCAAREQDDLARIEDGSDSHRDGVRRHRLIEKKAGVRSARRFTQGNNMRTRVERRSRLVERDMAVRSEAEKGDFEPTG